MLFEDLVRAIRDSPFFHGMPPDEQMSIARLGGVDVQPAGGVLFQPGEVPAALYLVLPVVTLVGAIVAGILITGRQGSSPDAGLW